MTRGILLAAIGAGLAVIAARSYAAYADQVPAGDVPQPDPWGNPFAGSWWPVPIEYSEAAVAVQQEQDMIASSPRGLSMAGLNAIKKHEGFVGTVYKDQAGKPTIGYGHLIKPGESFTTISEPEAVALLAQDVSIAVDAVSQLVTVPLSQHEFDALVSFTFNLGEGALASSTLLRKLNASDRAGATAEFVKWNNVRQNGVLVPSAGITNRRIAEARLFSGGAYA